MKKNNADLLTLIVIAAFSFMFATAIHEHGGHALACVLQGGHISEMGAFYVDCTRTSLSEFGNRVVAVAGPLVSFLTGLIALGYFYRNQRTDASLTFFLWHFATVNLMMASGYFLFSGVAGIGDLGTGESGAFQGVQPEWLVRMGLSVLGLVFYYAVIRISIKMMDHFIGGEGRERVGRAQMLSVIAYLVGGGIAILIGLFNPYGIVIVLVSSFASSMGGTSGMAWMMQLLDRSKDTGMPPFAMPRNWSWIFVGVGFILLYAIIFGRTLYL